MLLKRGVEVTEYDLDSKYHSASNQDGQSGSSVLPLNSGATLSREENEKRLLRNALIKSGGNRTQAAKLMGISRRTLHRKLVQWPELDVSSSR